MESAAKRPSLGSIAGITGILVSIFSATTVFAQLQSSLNSIWGIEVRPSNAIWAWLRRRVLSIGIIAAITFVLIVSLVISSLLALFLTQSGVVWDILNQIISTVIFTGLFTLLFRYLPDARLPWRFAIRGGVVTAVLFGIGKILVGLYLAEGRIGGAYGAAGSVVFVLVWVYYSSAIFFFGAEVVQSWVHQKGQSIPLTKIAERST
jgi:membrane protein